MKLVIIFGPPAVGKMSVGAELSKRTGLPLFHNHLTIEAVVPVFPFGHPTFGRLVEEFRRRVFEEVAASDLPGLIFTFVWVLNDPDDKIYIDRLTTIFSSRGADVCYVELAATLDERLRRNEGESRLLAKATKRNVDVSRQHLLSSEARHRTNTAGDFYYPDRHLRIDNTALSPAEVAERIIAHFGLPTGIRVEPQR